MIGLERPKGEDWSITDDHQTCCGTDPRLQGRVGLQAAHGSDQLQPCAHSALCVVLVRLRVTKVGQDPVAHVFRHEAAEAAHRLGDARLIGRNDIAQATRAESAAEPTRSENFTVTWRRSASVCGAEGLISGEADVCSLAPSAATALNSLSRAPSGRPSSVQVLIRDRVASNLPKQC
jgi:hypothetical protein